MTSADAVSSWRLCVAPMMQRTDRHFRYLARLVAPRTRLYTEMITTGAVLNGGYMRQLAFEPCEHPIAAQLGGSVPNELARATKICEELGFDEVNLNCGCPSERVKAGAFGACLIRHAPLVADCVKAMLDTVSSRTAISVKTRLGVDDYYSYDKFRDFVGAIAATGCRTFQVHARKALLSGLSPAENRAVPPLEYEWVYRLKREMPELVVILNGGITNVAAALSHLKFVDGVMLGRHAYAEPMALRDFELELFGAGSDVSTVTLLIDQYLPYIERELSAGTSLKHMTRHLLNLFRRQPGARLWRRHLTIESASFGAGINVIQSALAALQPDNQIA